MNKRYFTIGSSADLAVLLVVVAALLSNGCSDKGSVGSTSKTASAGKGEFLIPYKGDETTLSELKAYPERYVGKQFIICGGLRLDDYYNYIYLTANTTHNSLSFTEYGKHSKSIGTESAHLYLRKGKGARVLEPVRQIGEKYKEANYDKLARVKVTLLTLKGNDWDMLEVLDAQFTTDDKTWGPWVIGE